jgi:hypothetical protein
MVGYNTDISDILYHTASMTSTSPRQQDRAISVLQQRGIVRLSELTAAGITAATLSRMKEKGLVLRLGRGLYQLPETSIDANHSLAEAAKLVPKGVVCLVTALAFHQLTDTMPSRSDLRTADPAPPIPHCNSCASGTRCFARASLSTSSKVCVSVSTIPRKRSSISSAIDNVRANATRRAQVSTLRLRD